MKRLSTIALLFALLTPSFALAEFTSTSTTAAGSPGKSLVSLRFTASGTYTPTSNFIYITGCGAGGGGAGGHTADPGGGGGGAAAGMCVKNLMLATTPGTALTITIGTAGVGSAAGSNGGNTNVNTVVAGGLNGTLTLLGGNTTTSSGPGTVTNGGAGGAIGALTAGAVTGTGTGANGNTAVRNAGGDGLIYSTGAAGGGPSNSGGTALMTNLYQTNNVTVAVASGTKGGGGAGAGSMMGPGNPGGSGAVGTSCTSGYGAGGGGGAATFAGGNGCPGVLDIAEWK